jgi:sn-glycerol 3-phosphate transport system substrate-binding protein
VRRRSFLAGLAAAAATTGCRKARRDDGRTVVPLWFSYGGKNREVLLDLVRRFNAAQTRVFVEATFQGDYFEALAKLRTALAANAAPALSHVVGEVVPYLARAGVLEAFDGYEGAKDMQLVRALAQSGAYEEGDAHPLVAIPFNRSTPIMYVNGALQDSERFETPRTWVEMTECAKRLTRRGADLRWGFEVPISWWFWVAMVGQAGGRLVEPGGDPVLGGEAGEKALRYWQALVHEHAVMRPPPGRDYNAWSATNQDFLAGRAAFIWTSTAYLRYLEETAKFPVRAAPLPRDVRAAVPTGGTFFVVLRQAPAAEKEAAWSFLRWMCAPDQTVDWATRTGYMPVTEPAIERLRDAGYYAKHPNDFVTIGQLASVDPWPWAPTLFRIQREIVEPRLEDAVYRNTNAHAVMGEARAVARKRSA